MSKIIVVFGKTGSGKSYLTFKSLLNTFKRNVIYDSVKGYSKGEESGQFPSGVRIKRPSLLWRFMKENWKRNFRVIYIPQAEEEELQRKEFNLVSRIVGRCLNVCYTVDEVDMYVKAHRVPGYYNGLIQRGRHMNTSMIATTRRHAETSRMLTSQAEQIISFKQTEKVDINLLRNYFGERAEELKTLGQYEYLKYDVALQKITKGGGDDNNT